MLRFAKNEEEEEEKDGCEEGTKRKCANQLEKAHIETYARKQMKKGCRKRNKQKRESQLFPLTVVVLLFSLLQMKNLFVNQFDKTPTEID